MSHFECHLNWHVQVVQIGGAGGWKVIWTKFERTATFFWGCHPLQNIVMKKLAPFIQPCSVLEWFIGLPTGTRHLSWQKLLYIFRIMLWIVLGREIVLYVGVNNNTLKFQSHRKPHEIYKCKCVHHTHTHKLKRKIQIRYIIVKSKFLSFE